MSQASSLGQLRLEQGMRQSMELRARQDMTAEQCLSLQEGLTSICRAFATEIYHIADRKTDELWSTPSVIHRRTREETRAAFARKHLNNVPPGLIRYFVRGGPMTDLLPAVRATEDGPPKSGFAVPVRRRGIEKIGHITDAELTESLGIQLAKLLRGDQANEADREFLRVENADLRPLTPEDRPAIEAAYRKETLRPEDFHTIARAADPSLEPHDASRIIESVQQKCKRGQFVGGVDEPHGRFPSYARQLDRLGRSEEWDERDERSTSYQPPLVGMGLFDRETGAHLAHMTWDQPSFPGCLRYQKYIQNYLLRGVSGSAPAYLRTDIRQMLWEHPERIVRVEVIISSVRLAAWRLWAECIRSRGPNAATTTIQHLNKHAKILVFECMRELEIHRVEGGRRTRIPTTNFTANIGENMSSHSFTTRRGSSVIAHDPPPGADLEENLFFRREYEGNTYDVATHHNIMWCYLHDGERLSWELWNAKRFAHAGLKDRDKGS